MVAEASDDRSVIVENLSTQATEKDLQDFFSFCGEVENIRIEASPDGKAQVAHVTFSDVESVGTAVLLSDAIIAEAPISIRPVNESVVDASSANVQAPRAHAASSATPQTDAKQRESATDMVMRMIAVGYIKGDALIREVKQRALKFDEKHGLTAKAKTAATSAINLAQHNAEHLDDKYKLKQKAAFASFAFEKALNVGSSTVKGTVLKGVKAGLRLKSGGKNAAAKKALEAQARRATTEAEAEGEGSAGSAPQSSEEDEGEHVARNTAEVQK